MKVTKNFDLREFVPQSLWNDKGQSSLWYVNPVIIGLAQFNKDFFSDYFDAEVSVIINDWLWGGSYQESGYRYPASETGSPLSFHRGGLCSAFDGKYRYTKTRKTISPDLIRAIILDNEAEFMKHGLTRLESSKYAPTWVHQDCANTGLDHILVVGDSNRKIKQQKV